jgi:hypothetical protein
MLFKLITKKYSFYTSLLKDRYKTNINKCQNTFHDLHLTFYKKINRDFLFVCKRQLPF